ncbi:MAG: hypothetical protein RL154_694, partial [Pseudomonadota bacterium]
MLQKLLNYGISNNYFEIQKLKYIDKSCCENQECELIDFDKTAKKITEECGIQTQASCDCIKICLLENTIDFIELKGFCKFKEYQLKED